jgi:aldehyde:ferredoxin oxidoreductase
MHMVVIRLFTRLLTHTHARARSFSSYDSDTYPGSKAFSEPETQELKAMAEKYVKEREMKRFCVVCPVVCARDMVYEVRCFVKGVLQFYSVLT